MMHSRGFGKSRPFAWLTMAAFLGMGAMSWADDAVPARVTYTSDVAPIFFAKCATCHRPGELAPMSLLSYDDARPWAKSIKDSVVSKTMPPWKADPAFGNFSNDFSLSDAEIATIVRWVDQDAPRGNPADLPERPQFKEGWQLGEPDYIIELPEVKIPGGGPDVFPTPMIPIEMPEDRWIQAIEIRPGNLKVAHHNVLFYTPGESSRGSEASGGFFNVLAIWAVGTQPTVYPEGTGRWLTKKATIMANMHYHPVETDEVDRSLIGIHWGKGDMTKELRSILGGTMSFNIPAQTEDVEIRSTYLMQDDVQITGLFPHMHLRGTEMRIVAHFPDGTDETLINVPKWDFNWQWLYYPTDPIDIPMGTEIEIIAHYNNSDSNPNILEYGGDPNRAVSFGLQSTDEMMFGVFEFVSKDGVAPRRFTDQTRNEALLARYPADTLYSIDLKLGPMAVSAVLHLPAQGQGKWYLSLSGQMMTMPANDIAWDGSDFSFKTKLDLMPGMGGGGAMSVKGSVAEDGSIQGELAPGMNFQGQRLEG